jgi:hypothetical protein
MGTWNLPQSLEKAKKLQNLLKKPLIALDAENKLYDLLGDDDLFDQILSEQEACGDDTDVRFLVETHLRNFLDNKENATKPWDKEAFKICQNICKSIEESYIPY